MTKDEVSINGVNDVLNALEKRLGNKKVRNLSNKVVNASGAIVESKLKHDMVVFKDTGASIEEVVRSNASYKNYETIAKIGWNGPKGRYRLIHLNEWGYTRKGKQVRPKGFGVIDKSLKNSQKDYLAAVKKELSSNL
ncbi:hypothetical protein ACFFIF_01955 [Vagococcus entomophilus]|uniref:HK97 gp10 family phage protein n=1 Tax=Vagococcus entomophilus TaxID=1160095 RepID=A0A430AKC6_9ENTE|nr:hypothetical protein [Vagococcus entomophilus]RSU08434.1 hypothetical protein CBF30_04125 [Vagococcus entomophilus]